jgi:hypothetical protein
MRFTSTWSPMRSVFSIELEGIANAWTTKVIMNNPVANTAASEARNSTGVSLGFFSTTFSALLFFLAIVIVATPRQSNRFREAAIVCPERHLRNDNSGPARPPTVLA